MSSPLPSHPWRRLPLTAQLLAIGMVVSLAWFLTARLASDRQQAASAERAARYAGLRRANDALGRMGNALLGVSREHRGYLLIGDPAQLAEVAAQRRTFDQAVTQLLAEERRPTMVRQVDALTLEVATWFDSAFTPTIRLRQARGLAGFDRGSEGADLVVRGSDRMRRALLLQEQLQAELRRDLGTAALEAERFESTASWEELLILMAALAVFLLLLTLIVRLFGRALAQVIAAARALEAGRYREARFPSGERAPNRETAELAATFEQLATSIEQRERQLQDDIVKLKELDQLKRDFVSTVSHELRTPLTSMRGALGLILGGKVGEVPPKGQDLLRIAMQNTERLIRLINDILDVEKIDAGKIDVRRDRLQMRALVRTTITSLEGFAREHQVSVALAGGPEQDAEIIGDADRMVQVLTNLLSNAIKFSPAGGVVDVAITPEAGTIRVSVRDRGPGISGEFADRIFGRFQQASDPALHRSGGTGLGLSIAKSIVELHGGTIGFDAAEGGGTTFWVRVPTVAPITSEADPRRVILIVEDDSSMRAVLVAQFDAIARAVGVPSAEAALDHLAREEVAAIILDPGLPGMDGLTFARRVRGSERLRRMPMFLYSSREFTAAELHAAGIRAADAFVKSRDSDTLLFERLRHELQKAI